MLASALLVTVLWPPAVMQECKPADDVSILGVAQSTSGEFLYCEHIEIKSERELSIVYTDKEKKFAKKQIGYIGNPATPSVSQLDFRSGEVRLANIHQQQLELQYQANRKEKIQRTQVSLADVDVIDAGFDYFIRDKWQELQTGKVVPVNFASITHQRVLPLRVRKFESEKCREDAQPAYQYYCYFVEVDNAILRLILGNIKLVYDEQRRLRNFNGVVNIENNKGATQTANITYYYKIDYGEK